MSIKILCLTENYPPRRGGMAQSCDRIVDGLRKNGLYVDVAYFCAGATSFKMVVQQNGNLITVPVSDSVPHALNCLYNYLSDPSNDLKHTHLLAFGGTLPMIALPVFKAWLKLKAVVMLRGNDFDLSVFTPNKRPLLLDAVIASDAVSVLSSEARDKLELMFPMANAVKICNGISCENWFYDPSDLVAAEAFRRDNFRLGRATIGIIGQIKEKKGVVFFLENMLKSGFNEKFSLIVVGDVEKSVNDWIKEREEFFDIVFLPFMDRFELLRVYPACDFVALPSHYDGMPNVLLEAGALGVPMIAAQTGGIAEVLPAAQASLTFFPGNAAGCIEALAVAAAMSKEDRDRVGKILQKHICEEFSAEIEIQSYCDLFKSL